MPKMKQEDNDDDRMNFSPFPNSLKGLTQPSLVCVSLHFPDTPYPTACMLREATIIKLKIWARSIWEVKHQITLRKTKLIKLATVSYVAKSFESRHEWCIFHQGKWAKNRCFFKEVTNNTWVLKIVVASISYEGLMFLRLALLAVNLLA